MNKDILTQQALSLIVGNGIEIGAKRFPASVDKTKANVTYVDRVPVEKIREFYHDESKRYQELDIICNGETLELIDDKSQDFVIGSHVMEHFFNPLLALKNWDRVLKKNGIIYMIIPDKRTFHDRDKETTTYSHLLEDFKNNKIMTPEHSDGHEHFWTNKELLEIVYNFQNDYNYDVILLFERDMKTFKDLVIVLRKI